jgi:hypothetical protein
MWRRNQGGIFGHEKPQTLSSQTKAFPLQLVRKLWFDIPTRIKKSEKKEKFRILGESRTALARRSIWTIEISLFEIRKSVAGSPSSKEPVSL